MFLLPSLHSGVKGQLQPEAAGVVNHLIWSNIATDKLKGLQLCMFENYAFVAVVKLVKSAISSDYTNHNVFELELN